MRRIVLTAVAAALLAPAAAHAADPGRWTETGRTTTPIYYYQGMASDPARRLFFNGVYSGLYRTDPMLGETARTDDVIPPDVHAREQYNHTGDIAWDAREGGRVILPMECYYPQAAPGQDDPSNTCRTGSFAVADPETLQWRYYVKIDPAVMAKAMWVAVSPDGKLAWTGIGKDLFAFSMDDITAANAAPAGPAIKPVRVLKNARPPSGVTGAAFFRGRFYVAGQDAPEGFQVWSIDLDTGARTLEIERQIVGESEGIDFVDALGGTLHWMIQPYNTSGPPTYGPSNGTILNFVPKGEAIPPGAGPAAKPAKISLSASPRHVRSGRSVRMKFTARARVAGSLGPVSGAKVVFSGGSAETDAKGRATITVKPGGSGVQRARASRSGLRPGKANIRVMPRR
ncbi:MAG: hypothetical protein QOE06_3527 [Thermoleophilaceae bacterium]|jgi:hypothetical protein|nr:hypothetical protein [Thermoleophilaceae bacterium]